jgi:hypothetical protein
MNFFDIILRIHSGFSMIKVDGHNIVFSDGNVFLIEDFLLALDKRHIILDYYYVQTKICCLLRK